jgi:hypothetical protein
MRFLLLAGLCFAGVAVSTANTGANSPGDFLKRYDTSYNTLIVEKKGSVVEMRSIIGNAYFRESAVDLAIPTS